MVGPRDALVADLEMPGAQKHMGFGLRVEDSPGIPYHRAMVRWERRGLVHPQAPLLRGGPLWDVVYDPHAATPVRPSR